MPYSSTGSRAVLQRRNSLSNMVQAGLDSLSVVAVTWALVQHHVGEMTAHYFIMLLILIGTQRVVYDRFGIYSNHKNFTMKAFDLFHAWSWTFVVLLLLAFMAKETETFSRLLVVELYVLGLIAQVFLHLAVKKGHVQWMRHASQPDNVLIIGTGSLSNHLFRKVSSNPWLMQRVVGAISLEDSPTATSTGSNEWRPPILGSLDRLHALLDEHTIRVVYLVTPLHTVHKLEVLHAELVNRNVTIHWIPDIFSLRLVNHHVKEIAGLPVLTLSETPLVGIDLLAKEIEDKVLSALILILISPLLFLIALAIKLDDPGPVLFRQPRTGWNGRRFHIWKFRSMYVHQPENGMVIQAGIDDARVTPVGRFLRRTSLDELPQLVNVLMGDMSLVGPRPHAVQHDQDFSMRIAEYFARHHIKPGITGLAQVRGYRGEIRDDEDMTRRIESDIEYINNWSVWLDLVILLRTTTAFTGKKAY